MFLQNFSKKVLRIYLCWTFLIHKSVLIISSLKHKYLGISDAVKLLKGIGNMEDYNLLTINKIKEGFSIRYTVTILWIIHRKFQVFVE